jgi:signal transduction histidine kinase
MRQFWAQPLRRQLFIANLLLLVPVMAATVWFGLSTLQERREELARSAGIVAQTTAAYINRDFANFDGMAQGLAKSPAVVGLDPDAAAQLFKRVVVGRGSIMAMALADSTGAQVARVNVSHEAPSSDEWPGEVLRTGKRIITPTQVIGSKKVRYTTFGYPVVDQGVLKGSLALFVSLESLQEAFVSQPLPRGAVMTIADHTGQILARSVEPEKYAGRLLYGRDRAGSEAIPYAVIADDQDGIERVHSEALIDNGNFVVSVGIPVSVANEQVASLWGRSLALLGVALAGWLAVALVLSRTLGSSVSHLDLAAQRIAGGDFSPLERKPMLSRELSDLQSAFDRMLQRFNDTRQALDTQMAEERRIREELESLQGQVIRQERLAAVGQLVSGVAHEINNPLQAILGFAELLQMQPDVPDSVKSDLRLIQKESARACGIIRNLALFARQQPGEAAPVRLLDVVTSVAELRQRRLESEDIELRVEDESSEYVMAVLTELQQVVLNFVVNAEQSVVNSGRLPGRITVRTYDKDGHTVLEVEDTGPGVPPEHEAKLFQPFFTTKPVGQGTGLGLSVSYGIIDSLGGNIGYRRAPAGGSIFYFELPVAADIVPE